jgi:hypothetical protein
MDVLSTTHIDRDGDQIDSDATEVVDETAAGEEDEPHLNNVSGGETSCPEVEWCDQELPNERIAKLRQLVVDQQRYPPATHNRPLPIVRTDPRSPLKKCSAIKILVDANLRDSYGECEMSRHPIRPTPGTAYLFKVKHCSEYKTSDGCRGSHCGFCPQEPGMSRSIGAIPFNRSEDNYSWALERTMPYCETTDAGVKYCLRPRCFYATDSETYFREKAQSARGTTRKRYSTDFQKRVYVLHELESRHALNIILIDYYGDNQKCYVLPHGGNLRADRMLFPKKSNVLPRIKQAIRQRGRKKTREIMRECLIQAEDEHGELSGREWAEHIPRDSKQIQNQITRSRRAFQDDLFNILELKNLRPNDLHLLQLFPHHGLIVADSLSLSYFRKFAASGHPIGLHYDSTFGIVQGEVLVSAIVTSNPYLKRDPNYPLIFFIHYKRDTDSHRLLFGWLRENFSFIGDRRDIPFICDREQAITSAIKAYFPDNQIIYCVVHIWKSINQKIKQLSTNDEGEEAHGEHQQQSDVGALPTSMFLSYENYIKCYVQAKSLEQLMRDHDTLSVHWHRGFFDYFTRKIFPQLLTAVRPNVERFRLFCCGPEPLQPTNNRCESFNASVKSTVFQHEVHTISEVTISLLEHQQGLNSEFGRSVHHGEGDKRLKPEFMTKSGMGSVKYVEETRMPLSGCRTSVAELCNEQGRAYSSYARACQTHSRQNRNVAARVGKTFAVYKVASDENKYFVEDFRNKRVSIVIIRPPGPEGAQKGQETCTCLAKSRCAHIHAVCASEGISLNVERDGHSYNSSMLLSDAARMGRTVLKTVCTRAATPSGEGDQESAGSSLVDLEDVCSDIGADDYIDESSETENGADRGTHLVSSIFENTAEMDSLQMQMVCQHLMVSVCRHTRKVFRDPSVCATLPVYDFEDILLNGLPKLTNNGTRDSINYKDFEPLLRHFRERELLNSSLIFVPCRTENGGWQLGTIVMRPNVRILILFTSTDEGRHAQSSTCTTYEFRTLYSIAALLFAAHNLKPQFSAADWQLISIVGGTESSSSQLSSGLRVVAQIVDCCNFPVVDGSWSWLDRHRKADHVHAFSFADDLDALKGLVCDIVSRTDTREQDVQQSKRQRSAQLSFNWAFEFLLQNNEFSLNQHKSFASRESGVCELFTTIHGAFSECATGQRCDYPQCTGVPKRSNDAQFFCVYCRGFFHRLHKRNGEAYRFRPKTVQPRTFICQLCTSRFDDQGEEEVKNVASVTRVKRHAKWIDEFCGPRHRPTKRTRRTDNVDTL